MRSMRVALVLLSVDSRPCGALLLPLLLHACVAALGQASRPPHCCCPTHPRACRSVRLVSLAAQRFVAQVLEEAMQAHKHRQLAPAAKLKEQGWDPRDKRELLQAEDLVKALEEVGWWRWCACCCAVGGVGVGLLRRPPLAFVGWAAPDSACTAVAAAAGRRAAASACWICAAGTAAQGACD